MSSRTTDHTTGNSPDKERTRINAAREKQRHDADDTAEQNRGNAVAPSTEEAVRAHRDADTADSADTTEPSETKKSTPLGKKSSADQSDQMDGAVLSGLVDEKLVEQKRLPNSGNGETDEAAKSTAHVSKHASKAVASGDHITTQGDTSKGSLLDGGQKVSGGAAGGAAGGDKFSAAKAAQTTAAEKPSPNSETTMAESSERATELEAKENLAQTEAQKIKSQNGSEGAADELKPAESLVEQKGQLDNAERNRRVRAGEDPRERRLAAEKVGTKTADAKAVSPVETENTTIERVTREITVDLSEGAGTARNGGDGSEPGIAAGRAEVSLADASSRPPSLSQATQTLARRLNGELGDNIVRQAKVMLQDANHAELRLVIRPPELGRIRIRLQMENGHIAGRILVDNGSVREVVEQNLASLQRAFEEAGLEMGDLEVSTGDARDDADQANQGQKGSTPPPATAGVESFGRSIETISEYEPGRHRINLVA